MVQYWTIISLLSILPIVYCNYPQYYQKQFRPQIVKEVISPTKAERALQILKLATAGVNGRKNAKALEMLRGPKAVPQRRIIHNPSMQKQELPKQMLPKIAADPKKPIQYNPRVFEAQQIVSPIQAPPLYESYPLQSNAVNPFLPAASPISALAQTNFLPPAPFQARGNFLRKIPIPPPTL